MMKPTSKILRYGANRGEKNHSTDRRVVDLCCCFTFFFSFFRFISFYHFIARLIAHIYTHRTSIEFLHHENISFMFGKKCACVYGCANVRSRSSYSIWQYKLLLLEPSVSLYAQIYYNGSSQTHTQTYTRFTATAIQAIQNCDSISMHLLRWLVCIKYVEHRTCNSINNSNNNHNIIIMKWSIPLTCECLNDDFNFN